MYWFPGALRDRLGLALNHCGYHYDWPLYSRVNIPFSISTVFHNTKPAQQVLIYALSALCRALAPCLYRLPSKQTVLVSSTLIGCRVGWRRVPIGRPPTYSRDVAHSTVKIAGSNPTLLYVWLVFQHVYALFCLSKYSPRILMIVNRLRITA